MKINPVLFSVLAILCVVGGFVVSLYISSPAEEIFPTVEVRSLWENQCIDTMKSSRDRARGWRDRVDLQAEIQRQMQSVKSMGATCVSIGTPYDEEFVPYLSAWVAGARREGLRVWFRGNFAGWEGWFDYPRITSEEEHVLRTEKFISSYPELFEDGDIFISAPEAENGGPFLPGRADQYERYRRFLSASYNSCRATFEEIGKKVACNWFSMSGGHAKSIFTTDFTKEIDSVVTIDHYVRDTRDMGEFIDFFAKNMKARVVLGEFGGPIPDLNGDMTREEQAVLVRHIFEEMYERRDSIVGVNYWTLTEGSTKLLDDDYTERPVVNVLRDYYMPGVLVGQIVDKNGKIVPSAFVQFESFPLAVHSDSKGMFVAHLPSGNYTLQASLTGDEPVRANVFVPRSEQVNIIVVLE